MSELIVWIEEYRRESSLKKRVDLATNIYCALLADLRVFVFGKVHPSAGDDVLQETLKAIFTDLSAFRGNTDKAFLSWCYRIARNKVNDYLRKYYRDKDRLESFPAEELWQIIEKTPQFDREWEFLDKFHVKEALSLLDKSKPECREYLWNHYVIGFDYAEIAEEQDLNYDNVRMKIGRCLDEAKSLVA